MKINSTQKPGVPYKYGKDATERGSNSTGGGAPKPMGPRPTVGKMVPDQKPGAPKPNLGPKPSVGKPVPSADAKPKQGMPDRIERKGPPKPGPSVYRAKKGDGLWQVAEKTVPAGVSVSAWWAKIKKLNSSNGKVNRTYSNSGIKLPKS